MGRNNRDPKNRKDKLLIDWNGTLSLLIASIELFFIINLIVFSEKNLLNKLAIILSVSSTGIVLVILPVSLISESLFSGFSVPASQAVNKHKEDNKINKFFT